MKIEKFSTFGAKIQIIDTFFHQKMSILPIKSKLTFLIGFSSTWIFEQKNGLWHTVADYLDFYNKYDPHFLENAGLLQQKVNATPSFVAVLSFPTRYLRCSES